ncbi:MAG: FHA domain-containing protein [bacterium]|nr:FHA domain-containing protein [bacterium]
MEPRGLLIGRGGAADIDLRDRTVSRKHCFISPAGDEVHIEGVRSQNPFLVNGVPPTDHVLYVGDEFSIGQNRFLIARATVNGRPRTSAADVPATDSWRQAEYVSVPDDVTHAGPRSRPNTIPDLVMAHDFGRELSGCSSFDALRSLLQTQLKGRFRPSLFWVKRLYGSDEEPFLETGLGGPDDAPLEAIETAVAEQRGLMQASRGPVEWRRRRGVVMVAPACVGGTPVAVLALFRELSAGMYTTEDLRMLVILAQILAPILVAVDRVHNGAPEPSAPTDRQDGPWPIIGKSKAIRHVRGEAAKAARSNLNVLVTGETGTGKELVARMLHARSDRSEVPLVTVNCAAIPRELFLSVLFGHEKGAFTGAHEASPGLARHADGGILFLDEIGDLSPDNQSALLRVIETGVYRRVGSGDEQHVDMRVVAATNRPIVDAVDQGAFRQDLYHRINGFEIHIPPLRERPSDIAPLADHFFLQNKVRAARPFTGIAPDALDYLASRSWPGNVRELRNRILRAITTARGDTIQIDDVYQPPNGGGRAGPAELLLTLSEVEKRHILSVLHRCEGSVREAAGILEIGRTTLYKRMAEYGIER